MRNIYFILTLTVAFFIACKGQKKPITQSLEFVDTTKPFKKEIPTFQSGGFDLFYELAKARQKKLGLDSLESGYDKLQIRVWYDFARVAERKLVVIANKGSTWTAEVYELKIIWDGNTETILSKKIRHLAPKSGWIDFSKKLLDLKVLTLPNSTDIPNYERGKDGRTYNVEVATKNQYRFYGYWEPQENKDMFWQASYMVDILQLLEIELGI